MSTVSTYPNTTYIVADVYAATSWVMAAGSITWSAPLATSAQLVTKYNAITKASITPFLAATAQVDLITITNTANTVYQLNIQQFNPATGRNYFQTFTYTTGSVVAAGEISAYFKAAIDAATAAGQLFLDPVTDGTTTITITGDLGTEVFTATVIQGTMVNAAGSGNFAVGSAAVLALQGVSGTTPGAEYTTVHIEYSPVTGQNIKDGVSVKSVLDLYLNEGEGDYTTVLGDITADLDGTDAADAIAII
jgi:hypothetical protein